MWKCLTGLFLPSSCSLLLKVGCSGAKGLLVMLAGRDKCDWVTDTWQRWRGVCRCRETAQDEGEGLSRGHIHRGEKVTDESRWRWRGKRGKRPDLQEDGAPSQALYRGRVSLPSIFSTGTTDCEECSGALCSDRQGPLPSVSGPRGQARSHLTPSHAIARHRKGGVRGPMSSARTFALHMCRVDHILSAQREARRYESREPLTGGVSPPRFALPHGVFAFTAVPQPLHSSLPLSSWKGHTYPPSHLPTSAEIYQKITHLVSLDRIDIQSKCQSSSSYIFFFLQACLLPSPVSTTSRTVRGWGNMSAVTDEGLSRSDTTVLRRCDRTHTSSELELWLNAALQSDYPLDIYVLKIKHLTAAGSRGWQSHLSRSAAAVVSWKSCQLWCTLTSFTADSTSLLQRYPHVPRFLMT